MQMRQQNQITTFNGARELTKHPKLSYSVNIADLSLIYISFDFLSFFRFFCAFLCVYSCFPHIKIFVHVEHGLDGMIWVWLSVRWVKHGLDWSGNG